MQDIFQKTFSDTNSSDLNDGNNFSVKIIYFAKVVGSGDFKIQISGENYLVIFEFQSSVAEPNQMLDIF